MPCDTHVFYTESNLVYWILYITEQGVCQGVTPVYEAKSCCGQRSRPAAETAARGSRTRLSTARSGATGSSGSLAAASVAEHWTLYTTKSPAKSKIPL